MDRKAKILPAPRIALSSEPQLNLEKKLAIVPGATHLFEEPGTLVVVAQLAREWFVDHLGRKRRAKERRTHAGS